MAKIRILCLEGSRSTEGSVDFIAPLTGIQKRDGVLYGGLRCTDLDCPCVGATVQVGVDPSKVVITKLKIDKDRKKILERKGKGKGAEKGKGKFTEKEIAMANVD